MAIKQFLYKLAFHKNEKPRGWVRSLLFKQDKEPHKLFQRVVFRRNGSVRAEFATWMQSAVSLEKYVDPMQETDASSDRDSAPSPALRVLSKLKPLDKQERKDKKRLGDPLPKQQISSADLAEMLTVATGKMIVLSVGHDNYLVSPGGVQLCIQREQQAILARGDRYLNLRPFHPLQRLAHLDEAPDPWVELILDGADVGSCRISHLTKLMANLAAGGAHTAVVIHHLLGHCPEHISGLVRAAQSAKTVFWLHDFFTLCTNYTLQRNDVAFCNAPSIDSNACSLCVYGEERRSHLDRMERFFTDCDVEILSPSKVTLDFWQQHTSLRSTSRHVVPHLTLNWIARSKPLPIAQPSRVRIAFLGSPAPHKGWPLFERLAKSPTLEQSFQFVALTVGRTHAKIQRIAVRVTAENPREMADAVAANDVDIVLHWPSGPETFSLTTYEAFAGGAFVVTNAISGNVAAAVEQFGRGAVLSDEKDLIAFFRDGRAQKLAKSARSVRAAFEVTSQLGEISAPFLAKVH